MNEDELKWIDINKENSENLEWVKKLQEAMRNVGISSKDFYKHAKIEKEIVNIENNNPIRRK